MKDHSEFKMSWTAKAQSANLVLLSLIPLSQTMNAAIPINMNSVVQTGAKIQFGGLNAGLRSPAYHVGIDGVVAADPINPADRQTRIEKNNLPAFTTADFVLSAADLFMK